MLGLIQKNERKIMQRLLSLLYKSFIVVSLLVGLSFEIADTLSSIFLSRPTEKTKQTITTRLQGGKVPKPDCFNNSSCTYECDFSLAGLVFLWDQKDFIGHARTLGPIEECFINFFDKM